MAYQDTLTLSAATSDLLILSSAAGSSYIPEPDARVVNMSGGITFKNFTVSNGGIVSVTTTKPTLSGFQVFSGGTIKGAAFNTTDTKLYSGAKMIAAAGNQKNLSIYSGAVVSNLFTGAISLIGDQWYIESGAKFYNKTTLLPNIYTDEDHFIHNMPVLGAVHVYGGFKMADAKISSYLYMYKGTVLNGASGGYINTSGAHVGAVIVFSGASIRNVILKDAVALDLCNSGVTLGGSKTTLTNTPVWYCNASTGTGSTDYNRKFIDNTITIVNGMIDNMLLYDYKVVNNAANGNTSHWLHDITLVDGIQANAPIIRSGGTLTMGSGGIVSGAAVSNLGILSATADALVSGAIVVSSGGMMVGGDFSDESASLRLWNGATLGGATLNVASDKLYFDDEVSTAAYIANGSLCSLTLDNYTLGVASGLKVSNVTVNAGGALNVSNAAVVSGANLAADGAMTIFNGGKVYVLAGDTFSGAVVSKGGVLSAASTTVLNGVEVCKGGSMCFVSGVTLSGVTVHSGGSMIVTGNADTYRDLTVEAGGVITDLRAGCNWSGNINIASGAILTAKGIYAVNGVFYNWSKGTMGGGAIHFKNGITLSGGICQNQFLYVSSGAVFDGMTLAAGTGLFMLTDGGYLYNVNAPQININIQSAGTAKEYRVSGGICVFGVTHNVIIGGKDTYIVSGAMCYNWGSGYAHDMDAYAQDGVFHNLKLMSSGSWMRKLTLRDGLDAEAPVISAGGTLTLSSGVRATDVAVSGSGSIIASSGAAILGGFISGNGTATPGLAYVHDGATISGATFGRFGNVYLSGGRGEDLITFNAATIYVSSGADLSGVTMSGGGIRVSAGGVASNIDMIGYSLLHVSEGGYVSHVVISHTYEDEFTTTQKLYVSQGALVDDVSVGSGGEVYVSPTGILRGVTANSGGAIKAVSGGVISGAVVNENATLDVSYDSDNHGALIAGANTDIVAGGLLHHGSDTGATIENGVVTGLGMNGEYYRVAFGEGITVSTARVGGNARFYTYGDAKVYDLSVIGENGKTASVVAYDDSEYYNTVLTRVNAQAQLNLHGNNKAYNTLVGSGTLMRVDETAKAYDTTIMAGGAMEIKVGADFGADLTLDFTGGNTITINDLSLIAAGTTVGVKGVGAAGDYTLGQAGTLAKVNFECGFYGSELTSGGASFVNGATGLLYSFDGAVLTAASLGAEVNTAASLTVNGTAINGNDKTATWTAETTYTANVFLADGLTDGNAWLAIDGFSAAANVFGAAKDQAFTGTVNIGANAGTIKNLAAGAGLGGSVAGVKLTVGKDMSVTGAVYAGGMGDVTGATETLIAGGAFAGNVFAGALCNYAANQTATGAGDIDLTVDGGTFAGNIYAGAAVKAGAAAGAVHTAGDITVTLNDGTATKGTFCVYGGGYATGTTEDALVYTAGDVAISVNGGSWGTYLSGRGIFGGVYADKAAASVDKVEIAVAGGSMGNIYGGGWAQNGGTSTVAGEVSITIDGDAEIANVFGGGSYSSASGGATRVGSVSITVAGGSIYNNIFAGGQGEFSTVDGDVSVTFTGSNAYSCNVYGYVIPVSATSAGDKALNFADYTGILSGDVGGFDGITFTGDTAATLSGADIDNEDWTFDYTGRTLDAGLAMLTLDGGSFAGDESNVSVDLSAVEQVAAGWSIVTGLTSADVSYSVELSTGSAANLALDAALGDAYGIYEGWGFTLEDSTLKFKQLA